MDRGTRILAGLLGAATILTGCSRPVDPDEVTAHIVEFGRYEIQRGRPVIESVTTEIPCRLDELFGVEFRVEAGARSVGLVPVDMRWLHPGLDLPRRGLSGTASPVGLAQPEIVRPGEGAIGRALWSFDHPKELVPGRYAFEIRMRGSGRVVLLQAFDVEGCPAG